MRLNMHENSKTDFIDFFSSKFIYLFLFTLAFYKIVKTTLRTPKIIDLRLLAIDCLIKGLSKLCYNIEFNIESLMGEENSTFTKSTRPLPTSS